jgi:hypothetical protein
MLLVLLYWRQSCEAVHPIDRRQLHKRRRRRRRRRRRQQQLLLLQPQKLGARVPQEKKHLIDETGLNYFCSG